MNGNFVQNITSAIQNKQVFETSIEPKLIHQNWTTIVNMIDSHPKEYIKVEPHKNLSLIHI